MNIFVGALPFVITEEELKEKFEEFGRVVSVNIIKDKYTEQSKGFAFVEMDNTQEAKTAISKLNGLNLKGRTIVVNEAKPRESRPRGNFDGGSNNRRSGNNSRGSNNDRGGRRF